MYKFKLLALLYIPWLLSLIIQYHPVLSYLIAWSGSLYIFYITLFSPLRFISSDRPVQHQIMRPIILIQLIFAGFMCCTSIFYFLDHLGYKYLSNINNQNFQVNEHTLLIAKCQRMALLAHAALVTGIILMLKQMPLYRLTKQSEWLSFKLCILSYIAYIVLHYFPSLNQFKYPLLCISISCSAYILIKGMVNKHLFYIIFGGLIFGFQLASSTLTGYKESIIIHLILISAIAFPHFKRTILLGSLPCIYLLLYALPTFTATVRYQSWTKGKPAPTAREDAYQTVFDENNTQQINNTNWEFLSNRASEIGMFTQYIKQVPEQRPYYGLEIIINSCYALIPRVLWKEKPNTEKTAMERVYQLRVVNRLSSVSAKTRPIADAYLSAGPLGVFIAMLIYGMLSQSLCNMSEKLFGGYQLGCAIMFNGIFQQLWRGNTFEFLFNNIVYGYILMLTLYYIMKKTKAVQP